ncbi:MAG TPA: hypothetical protein VFA09_27015 [Ktedonobacteraceae bacterium]|nr:hypothetical protein [Ktedonobacteraceae bacterium]
MKVIKYNIELLEPVLVTSVQGDPNSSVAFDYLPGSVLRGVLIDKYLGSKSGDTTDSTLRRLFFDGTTRYLNGYLLDAYDHPSYPTPLSWQRVKDQANDKEGKTFDIFDFAIEPQYDDQQWQPVPAPFYTQSSTSVRLIRPARNVAVHTQRTPRFGRAMPELLPISKGPASGQAVKPLEEGKIRGAVYRYDALAAGQKFQAAIICDNDEDAKILQDLIGGYVTLGGSRSGGYGRAEIKLLTEDDSDQDATEDDEDIQEDKLIVTLQSDMLIRDVRGQFAVDSELLCQVLGRHLGVDLKLKMAFIGAVPIGGFNRKWGLPLPQALAVRMGSVLVFEDPHCDPALLHDLEVRGIGERRAEGFGRIAFNRQRVLKLETKENKRSSSRPANLTFSQDEARTLAELMVNRMLIKRLDESLLARASTLEIANPPSNAQISGLRSIVLEEIRQTTPGTGKIRRFIASIEARGTSRRQFERSTINREPLLRWLKSLLGDGSEGTWTMDDNVWKNLLGLSSTGEIAIGNVKANIDNALRLKYVLRLIDLVLARAAKEQGKEN